MIALLLAVAVAQTAVEAERAFAAAAKAEGQWTAFRRFADDDAVMFVPQPVNAQTHLKPLKDPGRSLDWWPTASWVACDGSYAVNTGGWRGPDGKGAGFFSTVWRRQPQEQGGWKWTVDGGGDLPAPRARPAEPAVRRAACGRIAGVPLEHVRPGEAESHGASLDGTLRWHWTVDAAGDRLFEVALWTGRGFERVLADRVPAPRGIGR